MPLARISKLSCFQGFGLCRAGVIKRGNVGREALVTVPFIGILRTVYHALVHRQRRCSDGPKIRHSICSLRSDGSRGQDFRFLVLVLFLIDLASGKALVQDLDCRSTRVAGWPVHHVPSPAGAPAHRPKEQDDKEDQQQWYPPEVPSMMMIAPHVPVPMTIRPLRLLRSIWFRRCLRDRQERLRYRDCDQSQKNRDVFPHNPIPRGDCPTWIMWRGSQPHQAPCGRLAPAHLTSPQSPFQ